jgi:hypothetical protein
MSKKKSDGANLKLRKFCSRLWLRGRPVWWIADAAYQTQEATTDDPSVMSGLIRAWRKQHPELFPLRHKKHAPRRKSGSYDITLRLDAEKFGTFNLGQTKKQMIAMVRSALRGDNDLLREVDILSIK